MVLKNKFLKISLGLLIGIFALYIGQEIFKTSYFFLQATIFVSKSDIIFVLPSIAYLYLITGLIRLKKWAVYLLSTTILSGIFLSIYAFFFETHNIRIDQTIISVMPLIWSVICIIISVRYVGLFILKLTGLRK
jgi:hypothetical protein